MTAFLPRLNRNIISILIIALIIFFGGLAILNAAPLRIRDKVANGFLADLVITFPVLYYFIIVRPLKVSAKSLLLIFSFCCGLAYVVLPQQQRDYILQIRKLSVLAELFVIGYAVTQFKKLRAAYNQDRAEFADPIYNLRHAMVSVLGSSVAIKLMASELAIIRYGLLFWRKEKDCACDIKTFTTHKTCGYVAIWSVLFAVVLIEMVAVHLLLIHWNNIAAIVVTSISAYGMIVFVADLSAMLKRKILIGDNFIVLRTGLRWQVVTTLNNIDSLQKITNDYQPSDVPYLKGGAIKTSGNLLITFKEPVKVDKLYGASKIFSTILMNVDEVESFITHIS
ncbi:hypothetical protein [Mucilaginibacter agri]|uniref:Uncharacterized protein n=1 Tax=Mucilaginibacter agri TaxID=2695265 RepID=A0A966DVC5_9SPHI|nr:hypothetical protein [Mucilaginibacter agri]NCD71317.1 hypothetical protein [Mucilaginibacter agri]